MIKNYLSRWIANLGVVPLLLFAVFLFLPILVLFAFLLFLVTLVLETIAILLYRVKWLYTLFLTLTEQSYLPIITRSVKVFFLIIMITTGKYEIFASNLTDIVMSKGEIKGIKGKDFDRFVIGNKEILSAKLSKNSSLTSSPGLLIKAKMMGFSQLKLYQGERLTKSYSIYVISKKRHMTFLSLKKRLKNKGLVTLQGEEVQLKGKVNDLKDYFEIKNFLKEQNVNHRLEFEERFKKRLLANIYYYFIKNQYLNVECEAEYLKVTCFYHDKDENLFKLLKEKYSIQFIQSKSFSQTKHYRVKLKLIQFENTNSKEFRLGLDKIEGNIGMILNNIDELYTNNSILLNNKNISYSTLAKPEITLRESKDVEINIGSEIPYQIGNNQAGFQQQWKFTGLKIKMNLQKIGTKFVIDYETDFTRPLKGQVISGSKQSSSISLKLDKPTKLFNIGFTSTGEEESALPYLSQIPLLGKLFTSQGGVETFKKVIGIISIEEIK